MSHRVWQALCALVLAAGVTSLGAFGLAQGAQRVLDGQLVVKSNGTIYLVQNGARYVLTPIQISDAEIDAIPDGGTVSTLQGVIASAAVFEPAAMEAGSAADLLFSHYWALGQWDRAYSMLHPDQLAVVPRNFFVDTMRASLSSFQITSVQAGSVEDVGDWTDQVTGKGYQNIVKVPVNLTLQRGGETSTATYNLYMQKVGDYYRWFWAPPA